MPGCLDQCFMYWEDHDLSNLDPTAQPALEAEIQKYREGKTFDLSALPGVIKRICLGGHLKDAHVLPTHCKHYEELPGELSLKDRMDRVSEKALTKAVRKWQMAFLIATVAGILVSAILGYLNYTKPSPEDLKEQVSSLQKDISQYQVNAMQKDKLIVSQEKQIEELTKQLQSKTQGAP